MIVDVHDQRFTRASWHPEDEFFNIGIREGCIHCIVKSFHKIIELAQEFHKSIEFPIQIYFGLEK